MKLPDCQLFHSMATSPLTCRYAKSKAGGGHTPLPFNMLASLRLEAKQHLPPQVQGRTSISDNRNRGWVGGGETQKNRQVKAA